MKGRQPVEEDDGETDDNNGGNEIIQSTPLPNAFVVHRRNHLDGSTWSATRLALPSQQSNINYEEEEKEDGKEENPESTTTTTTTTLEIVHSLVLGEDNDRFFFNPDYTIAASTGLTKVWDGTWTILRCLLSSSSSSLSPSSSSFPIIENNNDENNNQQLAMKLLAEACLPSPSSPPTNNKKRDDNADVNRPVIIEMGSGSGLVGLTAAYLGAHVLITDVPTVVENSLEPNIERNTAAEAVVASYPPWPEARSIGRGSVACASYDWRKLSPEENELPYLYPPNVILAVECLWLKDLLQPFVDASLRLLRIGGGKAKDGGSSSSSSNNNNITNTTPVMFMCSRERSKKDSQIFCSPKMAVQAFREAGCTVTLVMEDPAPPLIENNNISNINEEQPSSEAAEEEEVGPVQLYCIRPPQQNFKAE